MNPLLAIVAVIAASLVHAGALRIATRLMVDVRVGYGRAYAIVAAEYAAVAVAAAGLLAADPTRAVLIVACSLTYLAVGAALIGRGLRFQAGMPVGVGNAVLIQAIQIPLLLPLFILGSFAFGTA
jgi:hypothetical protein